MQYKWLFEMNMNMMYTIVVYSFPSTSVGSPDSEIAGPEIFRAYVLIMPILTNQMVRMIWTIYFLFCDSVAPAIRPAQLMMSLPSLIGIKSLEPKNMVIKRRIE